MKDQIRQIVQQHARLATAIDQLSDESDLYQAGLTSHASVNLMLALEEAFEVEFPERMLKRKTFESIGNIHDAIAELVQGRSVANA
jgi:acyl carrier protein